MDPFRQNGIPSPQAAEQMADAMLLARKPRAEIWQALVDKQVDAAIATAAVHAVVARHESPCARCGSPVLDFEAILSTTGDMICTACVERKQTAELYERALETAGTGAQLRRCRCSKNMSCIHAATYRIQWQTVSTYTFKCKSCARTFTGYEGTFPGTLMLVAIAVAAPLVRRAELDTTSGITVMVCLAVTGFVLHRYLIWLRHPVSGVALLED